MNSNKKQKRKYSKCTVNLNQRLSAALGEMIVTNLNSQPRADYLKTLNAENGTDAGKKVVELLEKVKGKQQQTIEEKSEKINENSQ